MRAGRLPLLMLSVIVLAGCGSTTTATRSLTLSQVPLVPGSTVLEQVKQCDSGSHAFCSIQAVIVNPQFQSSGALVATENRRLHRLGWKSSAGDDGDEAAASSPGQTLRVTFATAVNDLIGVDEAWINRSLRVTMALDKTMFDRQPAMSIMLETGAT